LNFDVYPGEILALVGGSGTGKTVLLRQILGLLSPSRGTVTVDGRPSREVISGELAASQVGMLFQQGALYSAFNVLDNIAFALREQGTLPDAVVRCGHGQAADGGPQARACPRACLPTCRAA
jgi:phospholipid/cholesterol/gamma-HCH transport system ATP-binding protein